MAARGIVDISLIADEIVQEVKNIYSATGKTVYVFVKHSAI
jgi:hypothetical protein